MDSKLTCWKCHKKIDLEKISFRSECPFCFADLHVCKNCKNYALGKPNDCTIPNIELVSDKEKINFCEEFSVKNSSDTSSSTNVDEISEKLFGEKMPKKKKLF